MRTTMRTRKPLNRFKRDYKRETKGKSAAFVAKLDAEFSAVVAALVADETLQDRHKDHAMSGDWKDHRDCHVRPDLVLIYRKPGQVTRGLVRRGAHNDPGWAEDPIAE